MSTQWGVFWAFMSVAGFCELVHIACRLVVRKNRRIGLPAPKYDERNSIATFKRMHQP